jgi:hypothetical protein
MTMPLWEFKIIAEIDDDGKESTSYEIVGDVTTAELVGEIEVIKAQIVAEALTTGDDE